MALRVDTIRASFLIRAGFPRRALEIARQGLEGLEDAGLRRGFLSSAAIASEILGDKDGSREYRDEFIQSLEPGDQDWQRRASSILTGHLALLQNRYDDAIQSLEAADALLQRFNSDPSTDSADVWSGLAMAHWEKGDKDESAKWLRKLLNGGDARIISPIEYVRSLEYLGRYHEERGDEEEALRYYRKYLEFWGDGELDRERVAEVRAKVEMR